MCCNVLIAERLPGISLTQRLIQSIFLYGKEKSIHRVCVYACIRSALPQPSFKTKQLPEWQTMWSCCECRGCTNLHLSNSVVPDKEEEEEEGEEEREGEEESESDSDLEFEVITDMSELDVHIVWPELYLVVTITHSRQHLLIMDSLSHQLQLRDPFTLPNTQSPLLSGNLTLPQSRHSVVN